MPCRITLRLRIIPYIGVGIHPSRIALYHISLHKPPTDRVVVAGVGVQQPRLTIQALSGELVVGGHVAPTIAYQAMGREELHRRPPPLPFYPHAPPPHHL